MKNILHETASQALSARLKASLDLVEAADIAGRRVLDVGCGFGWFELHALKRAVGRIVGTEISETDLIGARAGVTDSRASFMVAGATDLPFPDASFETVVSWEVIEHIPRRAEPQMFSEVSRVLKPGGVFYLSTPFASWRSRLLDPAWWLIGHRHYSAAQLSELAKAHGLNVEQVLIKGKIWGLLALINMYGSKWILRRRPLFERFFTAQDHREYEDENGYANIFVVFRKPS